MKQATIRLIFVLLFACGGKGEKRIIHGNSGSDSAGVWLATYLAGKKVGWTVMKCVPVADGFRFDNITKLKVVMMGKVQRVNLRSRSITNSDWTLRSFEFELGSQDGSFEAKGMVKDGWLILDANGARGKVKFRLTREVYPIEALGRVVVEAKPEKGAMLNYLTFDGAVLDTLPAVVTILGREVLNSKVGGISALKVRVKRAKTETTLWLDEDGMTIKEESPLGLNSYRVSEQEALSGETEYPVDLLRIFAVMVDTVIPKPESIRRVMMEVSGIDTVEFNLDWGYQRVTSRSPLRLEVEIPFIPEKIKLPLVAEAEYLKPSILIQSDAEPIRTKAQKIVAGIEDASVAAEQILNWVHRSLKKEAVASLPSALDVLQSLKGDCNEHSVLYAALARAVGIPSKVVVGLVYLDGAFYYHAWNEVYLNNWVPIDATFGEFPANALRLKLAEGDLSRQAEVLGLVKKIGIKVLRFN
ncbi:MAG: transglutaminase-like domain-containing protein [bacterium]